MVYKSVNSLQSTIFEGKLAIVTGAANGIGNAICEAFINHGCNVVALDLLEEKLKENKRKIDTFIANNNLKNKFTIISADLIDEDAVKSAVFEVIKEYETINILVNTAGGVARQIHKPIEEIHKDEWEKVIDINLTSTFLMTKAVVSNMKKNKSGRIINISSGAGRSTSLTGIQAYASAKAAQIGFTRQMAQELGPFGITVNNVAPGFVLSNPSTQKQWDAMSEIEQNALIQKISLKRLGKAEDIASPVLFFASEYASYISGQTISADGGLQLF
ncbi:SDR family NAD(P)-dependent oxidoreductase [Psychrobacillus sp. L4]|uniref:SDR family NAD(P)-dependent oxidoreductase n=1 Tax=Psychrobacillus sp. L4 TaxID=3236892 RepID=UPI0036F3343D